MRRGASTTINGSIRAASRGYRCSPRAFHVKRQQNTSGLGAGAPMVVRARTSRTNTEETICTSLSTGLSTAESTALYMANLKVLGVRKKTASATDPP
jgi:hypothetical protein